MTADLNISLWIFPGRWYLRPPWRQIKVVNDDTGATAWAWAIFSRSIEKALDKVAGPDPGGDINISIRLPRMPQRLQDRLVAAFVARAKADGVAEA